MKLSAFQKYLRALADVVGADKPPGKDLAHAANALTPFADRTMEQFAAFLALAAAKYGETGELPDGKPPKPAPQPKKVPGPKAPAPTTEELLATVAALKVRLRTDQTLTKDGVAEELGRFKKLKQAELFDAVQRLGIQKKQKNMTEAFASIVNYTVSAQGGVERSDA